LACPQPWQSVAFVPGIPNVMCNECNGGRYSLEVGTAVRASTLRPAGRWGLRAFNAFNTTYRSRHVTVSVAEGNFKTRNVAANYWRSDCQAHSPGKANGRAQRLHNLNFDASAPRADTSAIHLPLPKRTKLSASLGGGISWSCLGVWRGEQSRADAAFILPPVRYTSKNAPCFYSLTSSSSS